VFSFSKILKAKLLSAQFKALPEKERKKWEKRAEKDKLRYQEEMKGYSPPDDDSDEDIRTTKKKKKKDPNAPKRNMSAYFLFSNYIRASTKEENPSATFGGIAQLISAKFKALPEKERKKWEIKAEEDKARYQREMERYKS
jgi:high mobility group protein B2